MNAFLWHSGKGKTGRIVIDWIIIYPQTLNVKTKSQDDETWNWGLWEAVSMRAELLLMELVSLSNTPQRGPWLLLSCEDTVRRLWGINICRLFNPVWGIFRSSGLRLPPMDELKSTYSLCYTNCINIPLS